MTKKTKKIIVNALSLSRIIGALFLPLIFKIFSIPVLLVSITVLFITDFFDGFLARLWKVKTIGGSLLDPLGDKLLAIMCILSLVSIHPKFIYFIILETAIAILNIFRYTGGDKVKLAIIGKVKTWALSMTLILASIDYFSPSLLNGIDKFNLIDIAFYITIALEFCTLGKYSLDAIKNRGAKRPKINTKVSIKKLIIRLFDEESFTQDRDKTLVEIINSMEE